VVTTSNRTNPDTDLQEAANRHDTATAVVDALGRALDTIPLLTAEIRRLRRRLVTTLNDLNNLLAAAKATLSAHADGEEDPLYYLRDELTSQGQLRAEQRRRERP
jgi:redox-regulated HSP33 family molecular chaperone